MRAGALGHTHVPSRLNVPGDVPPITRAQSMQLPGPLSPMMLASGDVLSRSVPGAPHNPLDDYQLYAADRAASMQSLGEQVILHSLSLELSSL